MYPWRLAPDLTAPIHGDFLVDVHETRREMMEVAVREALAAAGPQASVIDLACCEGWFSHLVLEWGAARVVSVDIREVNVRRARLVAEELGVPEERLRFEQADVMSLDPAEIGTFDVVLNLGLIYHLENPVGAMRVCASLARSICVVDTLLTRQVEPLEWQGLNRDEDDAGKGGSFGTYLEPDEANPLASAGNVLSLIPNARAVEQMAEVAGFAEVEQLAPPLAGQEMYVTGARGMFVARAPASALAAPP